MTTRPRRTLPDRNQAAEHAKLRGWGCTVIEVHNLPGDPKSNPLDVFGSIRVNAYVDGANCAAKQGT